MAILRTKIDPVTGKEHILFRVAYRRVYNAKGDFVFRFAHVYAPDAHAAELSFKNAYPNRKTHVIIGVAPRVGTFAEDEHGDVLSA